MWTQSIVEQALAQQERMLAEAAKVRLLKLAPQGQGNPWPPAARPLKVNRLWAALALLVVLLLGGCSAKPAPVPVIPAGAHAGDLTGWTNCAFQPEGSKVNYAAECRTLVVRENWEKTDSRLIALPVVRVRASGAQPAEPVFFLNGGPGSPNIVWAPPAWLLKNHDVVLYNKAATVDLEKYEGIESVSLGNSVMGAPMAEAVWPMTAQWPSELIRKELREFQETDVDMLLVNGTADFSTPPTNLDETKPYFHNTQIVLLPEFSHVGDVTEQQPAAFERLITSYYDTGVADASRYVYQPLSFEPSMSATLMAKLVEGLFPCDNHPSQPSR